MVGTLEKMSMSTNLINSLLYQMIQSKRGCKDQESIQSSTTPDPGYQWESDNLS